MPGDRARRGAAMIEVLVALVLLATAGTGFVTLLGQTAHSMRSTLLSEREARRASEQLDRLALLDRASLRALAGRTRQRGWTLDVTIADSGLFDVSIAASDTTITLLRTTLYRPPPDSADALR